MTLPTGHILISRYRIVKLLGQGGFGAVYRAWDMRLHVALALKENLDTSPDAIHQFSREASILANLRHPNLPRVTDHFELPGQGQYLVMDFVEGEDLFSMLQRLGRIPEAQAVTWIGQVCDALAYLHTQQPPVIHRDIKPANIKITPQGQAMLVDFGIAKVFNANSPTTKGARAVTPGYSPYEQYGRGVTDARSDIYALGATLYVLVTGQEPVESIERLAGTPMPEPRTLVPAISPAIETAILKAMAVTAPQRFQAAAEFRAALAGAPSAPPRPAAPALMAAPIAAPMPSPAPAYQPPPGAFHPQPSTFDSPLPSPVGPRPSPPARPERGSAYIVALAGPAHFRSINQAVQNVPPGAQIKVSPGIYRESIHLTRPVEIISSDPATGVIVESYDDACVWMQTDRALLRGLNLRGRSGSRKGEYYTVDIPRGDLILEDCDLTSDSLAVVAIYGETTRPTLRRCKIHDSAQGGVFVYDNGGGLLEDCDISRNALPGIEVNDGGQPTLRRCRIFDGKEEGILVNSGGRGRVEDCDIYRNAKSGIAICEKSAPVVVRTAIHEQMEDGVFVFDGGQGRFDDCRIFGNIFAGVEIKLGGAPLFNRCQIYENEENGVFIWEEGGGRLEDCDIYANGYAGVNIKQRSKPEIQYCRINRNGYEAVWIHEQGGGFVENCDLTNNQRGAWDVEAGCKVSRSGNRE